jgi:hypothetical protein
MQGFRYADRFGDGLSFTDHPGSEAQSLSHRNALLILSHFPRAWSLDWSRSCICWSIRSTALHPGLVAFEPVMRKSGAILFR